MLKIILFFEAIINWIFGLSKSPAKCVAYGNDGDYVILLHPLAMSSYVMGKIERELSEQGYIVLNVDYPSRKHNVDQLVEIAITKVIKRYCGSKKKKIHFVGCSLGAILIRRYLDQNLLPNLGRVVMIAPPNQGSEIVDFCIKHPMLNKILYWWFGPAAMQLGSTRNSFVNKQLKKSADYQLGIIAGDWCINPLADYIIAGVNDGRVSVKNTKLSGCKNYFIIHSPHCFIAGNAKTVMQVGYFLNYGQFYRES